jgi:L-fuconolactonase
VPFVLAHAAAPPLAHDALHVWREQMLRLAAHPNVHCKLSALWSSSLEEWNLATLQSLFAFVLETFGERRILFGSDWPSCLPAHSWKETLARFTQGLGARTMEFREEVLGNTAARVYRVGSEAA